MKALEELNEPNRKKLNTKRKESERPGGGMKDMDAQDELLVHHYARSHLKQRYDEVVVDDSRGIGGFLWKFPSEGSNSSSSSSSSRRQERVFPLGAASLPNVTEKLVEPSYPRKCAKCQSAWVSDRAAERRHRKVCTGSLKKANGEKMKAASDAEGTRSKLPPPPPLVTTPSKLGIARRIWCEVDSTLSRLQWREDIDSEQDILSCSIPFLEIMRVQLLHEPANSFQVVTSAPRTVVFQFRPNQEEELEDEAQEDEERALVPCKPSTMDAQQWCEYLDVFSQYARQQKLSTERVQHSNQQYSPTQKESHSVGEVRIDVPAFDELVFARITRAIINEDVEALETMISASSDHESKIHLMRDESGSSLLIVALKLGAGQRIIRMLLDAGVDCNTKNSEEESPLLLVAAFGDDEKLQVLLQADSIEINQPCSLGATAFHAAANAGDLKILEMLCEAGTLTSAVGANGWTALHYAAACPTGIDAMHFLCELIPELIDCQCNDGNTALHVASGYGCVENVRTLLQTAANPHIQNHEGHTAYHVALHSNKIQCAVAINEYMANSQELYAATPRLEDDYEEQKKTAATATIKDDVVSPPSIVQSNHLLQQSMELFPNAWVEYSTPDGLPYFYNTCTGASSWHKPQVPKLEEQRDIFGHVWDDRPFGADEEEMTSDAFGNDIAMPGTGQQLSLCLIPMVSLLVSLDDPTAASKIESKRRKAREKRRANLRRHLLSGSSISKS